MVKKTVYLSILFHFSPFNLAVLRQTAPPKYSFTTISVIISIRIPARSLKAISR